MDFSTDKSMDILERTPRVLAAMLTGIDKAWTSVNEGGETWTVYDVIGHLIHGDKTDWMPRAAIILADNPDKTFTAFDRTAQFKEPEQPLQQRLEEFAIVRKTNVDMLRSKNLTVKDLDRTGIHPVFGEVTLSQLLATWVVHDLDHIAQISRVMAKQYKAAVGPWTAYLRILKA